MPTPLFSIEAITTILTYQETHIKSNEIIFTLFGSAELLSVFPPSHSLLIGRVLSFLHHVLANSHQNEVTLNDIIDYFVDCLQTNEKTEVSADSIGLK
jgi:hypothetical protein